MLFLVLSPWFGRLVNPFPYQDEITAQAKREGLDPYLVAAVVKVESGFKPWAKSPKEARGLMQLMPETAEWAAGKLGLAYDQDRLFEPVYNLRLGTWYLAYLCRLYNGDMVLALAAYNGGRAHVNQWLATREWSGRASQLDQIPFPETRNFVRKTLRNYDVYSRLYSGGEEGKDWVAWLREQIRLRFPNLEP